MKFGHGRVGHGEAAGQDAELLRAARVREARRNEFWVEIPDDLVERSFGFQVSAGSDWAYTRYTGAVWESGTANMISDFSPLCFYVRPDGECVFVEATGHKWARIVEKRARRNRVTV